ncbi:hypothetical protein EV360DRAFT_56927, partial [Lentinula raphanica]
LRRHKCRTRLSIAANMVYHSRERDNKDDETFWLYAMDSLQVLGEDGMSDEEAGVEDIEIDGIKSHQEVRLVKTLPFRHESFRSLFKIIDETPQTEPVIFTQAAQSSIKRHRSNIVDYRSPPCGYPEGIYSQQYLDRLLRYERGNLEMEGSFVPISLD